ncbi:hypothetical protein DL768_011139 [Monosporascus sp. mg162]|nr:hypothetical protein DL768_011139 [Monosporascus sp. mg162]
MRESRIIRRDSFPVDGLGRGRSRGLTKILETRVRHFVTAVLTGNEKVIQDYTSTQIIAFKQAIQARSIGNVQLLSRFARIAFEEMVRLARCDFEGKIPTTKKEQIPNGGVLRNLLYKNLLEGTVRSAAKVLPFANFLLGNQNAKTQQQTTGTLHAAGTASTRLELVTTAGLKILMDAVEVGDDEIVQILSRDWINYLRLIIFPGKASDRMMEVLVACRVKEFEVCFPDNKMDEARLLTKVGLELVAAATQGCREDARLAQLARDLPRIFTLPIRNGNASGEQLEQVFRGLQEEFIARFDKGNSRTIMRLLNATIEVVIRFMADEDARTAQMVARRLAETYQHIINRGAANLVENAHIKYLEDEFRYCIDKMADERNEELDGSRVRNLIGTLLHILHAAVRYDQCDVTERISDLISRSLEHLRRRGERIGVGTTRSQLLKCIPPWCEMDLSPVYCLETVLALLSAAQRMNRVVSETACFQELVASFSEPSPELEVLKENVREAVSSLLSPNDADMVRTAIQRLRKSINVGDILPD